jgi:hypothetical protein
MTPLSAKTIGGLVIAGVAGYFVLQALTKAKAQSTVASLTLSSSVSSGTAPLTVSFSGKALDASGSPVPNVAVSLVVNGSSVATPATDSTGGFSTSYTFQNAGTYTVVAKVGSISSSSLTITVSTPSPPPPTSVPGSFGAVNVSPSTTVVKGTALTFTGVLYATSGLPLPNWQVQLLSGAGAILASSTTDSSGIYSLVHTYTEAGTYSVLVKAANSNVVTPTLTITVTAPVVTTYSVTVTVTDSSTRLPVSGASVTMGTYSGTTNTSGVVSFSSVLGGSYTLSVTAAGYTSLSEAVTISTNSSIAVSLVPISMAGYTMTISATPTSLTASGGVVIISGTSNLPSGTSGYVRTENIGTAFNTPFTVAADGSFSVQITVPANTSGKSRNVQFTAYATVSGVNYKSNTIYVTQSG